MFFLLFLLLSLSIEKVSSFSFPPSHSHQFRLFASTPPIPTPIPTQFNVVLTHCTADFDTLASAVGLARLWSSASSDPLPTFVCLPRSAHPTVLKYLSLHNHLFPIRTLKSLEVDVENFNKQQRSQLNANHLPLKLKAINKLGLVDAQHLSRIGPASTLVPHSSSLLIVDHHPTTNNKDGEPVSDIPHPHMQFTIEPVGSVTTIIVEMCLKAALILKEEEATLFALGIHSDTGSLTFDSTTSRDVDALCHLQGTKSSDSAKASQMVIAEFCVNNNAGGDLSEDQVNVLTSALDNVNTTTIEGVSISTVLLRSESGFITGLSSVTKDVLDLSGSDVLILGLVYDSKISSSSPSPFSSSSKSKNLLLKTTAKTASKEQLLAAFTKIDLDKSNFLNAKEISKALNDEANIVVSEYAAKSLLSAMDLDGNGKVTFDEFLKFAEGSCVSSPSPSKRKSSHPTMVLIGRCKAGVNLKSVNLAEVLGKYGGGGHPKAASASVKLDIDIVEELETETETEMELENAEPEAKIIMQNIVDTIISTSLVHQSRVSEFMTSPVLFATQGMKEADVEGLFKRIEGLRALPVCDENNAVVGLVTFKEIAMAKQRLLNKLEKHNRKKTAAASSSHAAAKDFTNPVKGWMLQHFVVVHELTTMKEAEEILLNNEVGYLPVVEEVSNKLVGMITRTDVLRHRRYYGALHYHNKGFADKISNRKGIIGLRKALKQFDLDDI